MTQIRLSLVWLNRPLAFLILTALLAYWIVLTPFSSLTAPRIFFERNAATAPPLTLIRLEYTAPFALLARTLHGDMITRPRAGGITNIGPAMVATDEQGAALFRNTNIDVNGPPPNNPTASRLEGTRTIHTYGLLSGCIVCYRTTISIVPIEGLNPVPKSAVNNALNTSLGPSDPPFVGLRQSATSIRPWLLVHDLLFLMLLLLWCRSFLAVPKWKLWEPPKRATPSLSKKHSKPIFCPSCGYPTEGLATSTCPECGNPTQTHGS